MSDEIDEVTPDWWIPFETVLCDCGKSGGFKQVWMFLGIGPYWMNASTERVQIFVSLKSGHNCSWSRGEYMRTNFHEYDPASCGLVMT